MQVDSVSLNGRISKTSFGENSLQERFAALSENELRQIAHAKTSQEVNDKKHRLLDRAIIASVPLAAGIAAAAAPKSMSRIGRLASFAIGAASWILPFAVVDGVFGAERLAKKNRSVSDFVKENPFVAMMGTFAVSIGAYLGLRHGAIKGLDKYGDKMLEKATPYMNKLANSLNNNKVLDKLSEAMKKVPSSLKEFSKSALNWSPWVLLLTSIAHTFGHDDARAKNFAQNLEELKNAQKLIRQDMMESETADLLKETHELAQDDLGLGRTEEINDNI